MSIEMITAKRRARRIASDEAHAWARSLHLNNPNAKSVLRALALYVNGEGECFVGLEELAADTDLSVDTVRRRMAWLEDIGSILRIPQWFDGKRRNGDGVGKRTTDLVRLLIDADPDAVEARADGYDVESSATSTAISPSRQQGLNPSNEPVSPCCLLGLNSDQGSVSPSPALAVVRGANPSNLEPESPPKDPPPGGVCDDYHSGMKEPEHFAEFWQGYPGHEVMSRFRALEVFVAMTPVEQQHARAAVPELAAALTKLKRRARDAYKWLADKGWNEFPKATIAAQPTASQKRMIKLTDLAAVQIALRIGNRSPLPVIGSQAGGDDAGFWARPIERDLLALAAFALDDQRDWQFVESGSPSCAAWRDRLSEWLGGEIQFSRKWLEDYDAAVHGGAPSSNPNFRIRNSANGLFVPRPFPPRRDGGWADDSGEAA